LAARRLQGKSPRVMPLAIALIELASLSGAAWWMGRTRLPLTICGAPSARQSHTAGSCRAELCS
jgi:hypothetical protein